MELEDKCKVTDEGHTRTNARSKAFHTCEGLGITIYILGHAYEKSLPRTEAILLRYNPLVGCNYFFKISLTQDLLTNKH